MDDAARAKLNREGRRIGADSDAMARRLGIESFGPLYYDRQGKPMGMGDWAASFEDFEGRRVATTYTRKPGHPRTRVSTVWLGIDHNHFPGGPPLIFETMVFGGPLDGDMDRYSTEQHAREGHDRMVARVLGIGLRELLWWELTRGFTQLHPIDYVRGRLPRLR